jgi:hypothetical protein
VERVEPQSVENRPTPKSFRDFSSVEVECTALGASASLGSLSVPSAWPTATRTVDYTPAVAGKPPGLTYQERLMDVMTGRHAGTPSPEAPLTEEV